jgi:hypothetical protein
MSECNVRKRAICVKRKLLIMIGVLAVSGCSGKANTPSDYIPSEGPSDAWIIAIPNPVPAARNPGKTIVTWYTGDGSPGEVYVSIDGGAEKLFSDRVSHHDAIITYGHEYEFRLYAGTDHTTRLGTVRVTRDQPISGRALPGRDRVRARNSR